MRRCCYLMMMLLLLLSGASAAQQRNQPAGAAVKRDLLELFKLCRSERFSEVAGRLVYRGPDKAREWVDAYNYQHPAERGEVESVVREIKELLERSDSYRFSRFVEKVESEGQWHVWEVTFEKGKKRGKIFFAFLKVGGRYLLGDIDGHLAYLRSVQ